MTTDVTNLSGSTESVVPSKMGNAGKATDGSKSGFSEILSSAGQNGGRKGDQDDSVLGAEDDAAAAVTDEAVTAGEQSALSAQLTTSRLDLKASSLLRANSLAQLRQSISTSNLRNAASEENAAADAAAATLSTKLAGKVTKAIQATVKGEADATDAKTGTSKTKDAADESVDESQTAIDVTSVLSLLSGQASTTQTATPVQTKSQQVAGSRAQSEKQSEIKGVDMSEVAHAALSDTTLPVAGAQTGQSSDEDAAASGDGKTFRLTTARSGGAVSMDMTIGKATDGSTTVEAKASTSGSAENVVVLDARRYLGFGQSINGAAVTSAVAGDPEWQAAMQPGASLTNAASQSSTGNVVNTLKIEMTPMDLGTVTATLRLVGEELNVHLTVDNHAAYKQLSEDSSSMMDALRSQGFSVDQVTVSITPASQTDTSASQGDLSRQAPGSDLRQDGRGQGQQGQSSARNVSGIFDNESATDTANTGSSAGVRSGQLYL